MNYCFFVGKLASDPELKEVGNTVVVNFALAVEEHWKEKDGTKNNRVDFFNFEAWDSGASTIAKIFKKGDIIAVESEARQHKWDGKDGTKRQKVVYRVKSFRGLGTRNERN